jgi:hypothetical protein
MVATTLYRIGLCIALVALSACAQLDLEKYGFSGPQKQTLTIADVNPDLKGLEGGKLDAVKQHGIKYAVTGDPAYDKFFKDAAIAYGGFEVARTMSADVTKNLKDYARSLTARTAVSAKPDGTDGITPEEEAILKAQRQKLSAQETESFIEAAKNVGIASVCLTRSGETIGKLLPQAQKLVSDVATTFGVADAPGVSKEIHDSMLRLSAIKDDALPLAKNLTRLTVTLAGLTGRNTDVAEKK